MNHTDYPRTDNAGFEADRAEWEADEQDYREWQETRGLEDDLAGERERTGLAFADLDLCDRGWHVAGSCVCGAIQVAGIVLPWLVVLGVVLI